MGVFSMAYVNYFLAPLKHTLLFLHPMTMMPLIFMPRQGSITGFVKVCPMAYIDNYFNDGKYAVLLNIECELLFVCTPKYDSVHKKYEILFDCMRLNIIQCSQMSTAIINHLFMYRVISFLFVKVSMIGFIKQRDTHKS